MKDTTMTLSAAYLSNLLGVSIQTIEVYLCGWGFSHIQKIHKGGVKHYKYVTAADLEALENLAKRRRRKCKR